jgi:carboxynorspermidine decarboxylase
LVAPEKVAVSGGADRLPEIPTPYYLIDENLLRRNLEVASYVRAESGAKSVLALKCFSTWSVFDVMAEYLDGTTSSSLFEARLGHEKFGKETHAYSVAWTAAEVAEVATFASKVIFNSAGQLESLHQLAAGCLVGVRVNPGISHSHFDLADPARRYSRLGIVDDTDLRRVLPLVSGVMFHFNCENDDVASIEKSLDLLSDRYSWALAELKWVSLGGGIAFTNPSYDLERFVQALKKFSESHGVQIYLEPGEAMITKAAELVTTVLDVVHNEIDVAIVDASVEAHMLDHLIYGTTPALAHPPAGEYQVMVAGRTCLAGDSFGIHSVDRRLAVGDQVRMADAAGYTMVKKNWFNGVRMPSIVVRRSDGSAEVVREFTYDDFLSNLS